MEYYFNKLSPLIYLLIGSFLTFWFNSISNKRIELNRVEQQREIWKKQFDIFQAEPLLNLFKQILIKIQNESFNEKTVDKEIVNKLDAEISVISFLDSQTISELKNLYSLCLEYNNHINNVLYGHIGGQTMTAQVVPEQKDSKSTDSLEENLRKKIKDQIIEITSIIKNIYPRYSSEN